MTDRTPPPSPDDFAFFHDLRVRWAEVDPQGIVFNANYLVYADTAFTEYMRALGFPYPDLFASFGTDLFVVNASLDYRASARFDDELKIGVRVDRFGRSSMRMAMGIFRDEEPLVDIALTYVNANLDDSTPAPVPQPFVDRVLTFERTPPTRN
ncbi:MAG: thioesterase family protein [Gemmatimonadota bacterium]